MLIRDIHKEDLGDIIECHLEMFPDAMNTLLGVAYLRRYYHLLLQYDGSKNLAIYNAKGEFMGFIFALPNGYSSQLSAKLKWWRRAYLLLNMLKFFKKTATISHLFNRVRSRSFKSTSDYRLVCVAVRRNNESLAVELEKRLMLELSKLRSKSIGLSVYVENKRALCFYYKQGYVVEAEDRILYRLIKHLC